MRCKAPYYFATVVRTFANKRRGRMKEYKCPVCEKRACDSNKILLISKLSNSNSQKADVIIKCKNCKNCLSIKVSRNPAGLGADASPTSESFL